MDQDLSKLLNKSHDNLMKLTDSKDKDEKKWLEFLTQLHAIHAGLKQQKLELESSPSYKKEKEKEAEKKHNQAQPFYKISTKIMLKIVGKLDKVSALCFKRSCSKTLHTVDAMINLSQLSVHAKAQFLELSQPEIQKLRREDKSRCPNPSIHLGRRDMEPLTCQICRTSFGHSAVCAGGCGVMICYRRNIPKWMQKATLEKLRLIFGEVEERKKKPTTTATSQSNDGHEGEEGTMMMA